MKTSIERMNQRIVITRRGPGIGMWSKNSVLLVGDKPTKSNIKALPFVFHGGCAPWLANLLESNNIPETSLYWVNSADTMGRPLNPGFIIHLNPIAIIALGNNANDWCKRNQLQCTKVPHPQYWKRFKSKQPYPLIDELKRIKSNASV